MIDFPVKLAGETKTLEFAFYLPVGVTIASAEVEASVYSGVDADPDDIISGSATDSGYVVSQNVTDGVVGVIYLLTCTAPCSNGQTLQLTGMLAVL